MSYTFELCDCFEITDGGIVNLKPSYRENGSLIQEMPPNLIIPDTVNGINVIGLASGMFYKNNKIERIMLPLSVTSIPDNFCNNAVNFKYVLNTDNITALGSYAFADTPLEAIYLPNIETLGSYAFMRCGELSNVVLGNSENFTIIPEGCFARCTSLKNIVGGLNIKTIEKRALYICYNLSDISNIVQGLKKAGKGALIGERGMSINAIPTSVFEELRDSGCSFGIDATALQTNECNVSGFLNYQNSGKLKKITNRLPTKFNQANPQWADIVIGSYIDCSNAENQLYRDGCFFLSFIHAYCGIRNYRFNTIEQVEKQLLRDAQKLDGFPNGRTNDKEQGQHEIALRDNFVAGSSSPYHIAEAVGIDCIMKSTSVKNNDEIQEKIDITEVADEFYADLQTPNTYLTLYLPNHNIAAYGVDEFGKIDIIDSGAGSSYYGKYTPEFGQIYPQNIDIENMYYIAYREARPDVFKSNNTLAENVAQAISDFDNIKTAIVNKGVAVPNNTATSSYSDKIDSIQTGDILSAHGVFTPTDNDVTSLTITGLSFKPKQIVVNAIESEPYLGAYANYGYGCPPENGSYVVQLCTSDRNNGGASVDDYYKSRISIYHSKDGVSAIAQTLTTIKSSQNNPFSFTDNGFSITFPETLGEYGKIYFKKGINYYWSVVGE